MLLQIIQHTPVWVFGLFALLLWLGARQLTTRRMGMGRVTVMGVGLAGLSLYGTVGAFPHAPLALVAWAVAASAVLAWMLMRPAPEGTRYDAWQNKVIVPGSALPLALMMGVFATKYVVGVVLAMNPSLAAQYAFAVPVAAAYGLFSGAFAARSLRLWKLALRGEQRSAGALSA